MGNHEVVTPFTILGHFIDKLALAQFMGTLLGNQRVVGSSPARTTAEGSPEQGPGPLTNPLPGAAPLLPIRMG